MQRVINFKKIYEKVREDGIITNSIIVYFKTPHLFKRFPDDYLFTSSGTEQSSVYVAQYRKAIYLNLWLVEIKLSWYTKELDRPDY